MTTWYWIAAAMFFAWLLIGSYVKTGISEWHIKWSYDPGCMEREHVILVDMFWPLYVIYIIVGRRRERFRFWTSREYRTIIKHIRLRDRLSFRDFMYRHYVLVLDRVGTPVPIKHLNMIYCRNKWEADRAN